MLKRILKAQDQSFFSSRTPSGRYGLEVDFILVRGTERIAIEAKSGAHLTETWCKSLRALKPLEGLTRRIVVYPSGPVMKTKDGIDILPFKHLADELAAGSL